MTSRVAIVLAAGRGTRMMSRTPKVLHRVCGREMVALVVDAAREAGYKDIVVVVPPAADGIRALFGESVRYAVQAKTLGSGHAVLAAKEAAAGYDHVAVLYGDAPLIRPETLAHMGKVHAEAGAAVTLLTSTPADPFGLGRIVRDGTGRASAIVEEADADAATRATHEINAGAYCFRGAWLWPNLEGLAPSAKGEVYLTDLVARAYQGGQAVADVGLSGGEAGAEEGFGVNDRVQLARAEAGLRRRIRERWMLAGVTMPDPESVYIDAAARIGQDTVILPNTHIKGASVVGANCELGPNTVIEDSTVGDGCRVTASFLRESTLKNGVVMGPFSHVRHGAVLADGVRLGNYAEVKNSTIGARTRAGHFSYLGDAEVGADVNVGAGSITCNFDGVHKHRTTIGDGVFIGSDTMLVAPVTIGRGARTGAGSVVTEDVPPDTLVYGVPAKPKAKGKPGRSGKQAKPGDPKAR